MCVCVLLDSTIQILKWQDNVNSGWWRWGGGASFSSDHIILYISASFSLPTLLSSSYGHAFIDVSTEPLPLLPLRVSPPSLGPPPPPAGAEPGCTGRGSPAAFQSGGRPACWSGRGGPGGTAARWGPETQKIKSLQNCNLEFDHIKMYLKKNWERT